MRVVFAAMFVVVAVFGAVVAFDQLAAIIPSNWMGPVTCGLFFVVFLIALRLFSPPRRIKEQIADLESKGLIVDQSFKAVRAFQAEEFEDEGVQYFIELEDGSILFLVSQYLYDFDPAKFPSTEFTIRRHKTEDYVVEIRCGGKSLKPEVCVPPLSGEHTEEYCGDGLIIRDKSYDALKAELMNGKATASRRG
jgi:hypothetical protein